MLPYGCTICFCCNAAFVAALMRITACKLHRYCLSAHRLPQYCTHWLGRLLPVLSLATEIHRTRAPVMPPCLYSLPGQAAACPRSCYHGQGIPFMLPWLHSLPEQAAACTRCPIRLLPCTRCLGRLLPCTYWQSCRSCCTHARCWSRSGQRQTRRPPSAARASARATPASEARPESARRWPAPTPAAVV